MARAHRMLMTGTTIVCLISAQWQVRLFASEEERSSREASSAQLVSSTASETQAPTPAEPAPAFFEPAPAISIDEHSVGTTDLSSALPQMARSRFTLNAGDFTATSSLGLFAQGAHRTFNFLPAQSNAFAGQIYQGRPYRIGRDGSLAAIMVGSVVAIAGAAILVYANRPECDVHEFAGGCGYGTKVVGGAVLSGGIVSLVVGALTWR